MSSRRCRIRIRPLLFVSLRANLTPVAFLRSVFKQLFFFKSPLHPHSPPTATLHPRPRLHPLSRVDTVQPGGARPLPLPVRPYGAARIVWECWHCCMGLAPV